MAAFLDMSLGARQVIQLDAVSAASHIDDDDDDDDDDDLDRSEWFALHWRSEYKQTMDGGMCE